MRSSSLRFLIRVALVAALAGGMTANCVAWAAVGGAPGGGAAGTGGGTGGTGGGTGGTGGGAGGTGGGAGGTAGGGSGGGNHTVAQYGDPNPAVSMESISQAAQQAIDVCAPDSPRCIADALDQYAAALQELVPKLPPRLRTLPAIVRKAATKVRRARTSAEAVAAVENAIAQVHKTIALLKADDPITVKTGTREGSLVEETLQVADDKLQKAMGL